jgi:lysophospholipase L1-like esterase
MCRPGWLFGDVPFDRHIISRKIRGQTFTPSPWHNITAMKFLSILTSSLLLATLFAAAPAQSADLPPAIFRTGERILFQGDSITDMGRGRTADPNHILGQSYCFLIAARYGAAYPERNLTFINRGISGNIVSDLAARWQKDTLDLKPDVLSILIGVNDVWHPLRSTNHVSVELFEQTYDKILADARASNPNLKIVLCEPFIVPGPANRAHWDEWQADIRSVQAVVEKLAAKYHAPVVHFRKAFDEANQRGTPADYWSWDGVHPTYSGSQLMADEWISTYQKFFGKASR